MADNPDDLLNPAEIEALLKSAGSPPPGAAAGGGGKSPLAAGGLGSGAATPTAAPTLTPTAAPLDSLSGTEIEALLQQRDAGRLPGALPPAHALPSGKMAATKSATKSSRPGGGDPFAGMGSPEELLNRAEADLAAALSGDAGRSRFAASQLGGVQPYEFEQFGLPSDSGSRLELQALREVELDLRIELGRTQLLIEEVLKLREGSVVPLDKLAGDPVDIIVNGRLIGRGEVLVLNDNFCVRVAEILAPTL